jgi:hypothetical protein
MKLTPTLALLSLATLAPRPATAGYDGCPSTDWTVSTLALEVEQAFIARRALDLRSAISELGGAVACLDEAISPETAAAVHRAYAMVALSQGDEAAATAALQAALTAEPTWEPTIELAPPASDLAMSIDWAQVGQRPTHTTLTTSSGLALRLDGAPSWRRPDQLPVVLQLIDREGRPILSDYLLPDAPLPDGVASAAGGHAPRSPRPLEPSTPREPSDRRLLHVGLMGGAGALAATALGLGLASASERADWEANVERCEARVEGCSHHTEQANEDDALRAKRLGTGAAVTAAGGVALGVTLALTW